MRDKKFYSNEIMWHLPNFGLSAFNVFEAAEFVAKLMCLEDNLVKKVPDERENYCLNNPSLPSFLKEEIEEYTTAIISGIEKGSLKTLHISRGLHDQINYAETFVDIDILHKWFAERGVEISGDLFADYLYEISDVSDYAIDAILIQENRKRNGIKDNLGTLEGEKIHLLEQKISDLELQVSIKHSAPKDLGARERETLLKIIIGMAADSYRYDPKASKSPIPKQISDDLFRQGITVSDDTIRKWLKEASEYLPTKGEIP